MPHFQIPIAPNGPVVQAAVLISPARQQALTDAGLPIPPPQRILALLDTGAGISAVEQPILEALSLNATGEAEIHTPSTNSVAITTPTYDVRIAIIAGREGDLHFISDTVQVIVSDLSAFGVQVLIGRDILSKCIFSYNGADGCFTLAY